MPMNLNLSTLLPPNFQAQLQETLVAVSAGLVIFLIAVVIALIGWLLALALSRGIQGLLSLVGIDAPVARLKTRDRTRLIVLPSRIAGYLVFWSTFLAACVVALRVLGLDLIPSVSARLQDVVPRALTCAMVLLAGVPMAIGAARLLSSLFPLSTGGPGRLRYQTIASVLVGFVVLLALEQLGLAAQLVLAIAVAVVGAAGLALALAFGLGCRDLARDLIIEYLRASESEGGAPRS